MSASGKILVVDDDQDICETISEILMMENYDASVAFGGAEALAALKNDAFDCVLLDLRMPDMNGLEVLRKIKKIAPELPIIIHSALGFDSQTKETLREGAFAAIQKPINFELLFSTLDSTGFDGIRILIVSGDTAPAETARDVLLQKGYLVQIADNVKTALSDNVTSKYDLMILDFESAGAGDIETLRKIRYIRPNLLFVARNAFLIQDDGFDPPAVDINPIVRLDNPLAPSSIINLIENI
jgi:two-component system, NtrC family, response regulator HydG